jgi:hypothetical protein
MHRHRLERHGDLNFGRAEQLALGYPSRRARTPNVTINCAHCKQDFVIQASHALRGRKFCSATCQYAASDKKPTFACEHCGKVTLRSKNQQSQGYNYKQRFCSRDCADNAQRTGFIDKFGYRVHTRNGIQYFEHREVMERALGRDLLPHETVHHINGQRSDNRLENLELWSGRHGKGQRAADRVRDAVALLREHPRLLADMGLRLIALESQASTDLLIDEGLNSLVGMMSLGG